MRKGTATAAQSDASLAFTFLGMLTAAVVAAVATKSVLVLVGGIVLAMGIQRALIGGARQN